MIAIAWPAVYRRALAATLYAGSHGPDVVGLMGDETGVPGASSPDAGQRIRRRFTAVLRRENGEWRHDLRHTNVVGVE